MTGRSLPHAVLMMIPEPWRKHESMAADRRAFYEYHSALMEPWDGPASIAFTDGTVIGAVLDRNGLRPSRYYVTKDDLVVMASEVGVLDVAPENVLVKERLHPGRIFLVDTAQGRIIDDEEIKSGLAAEHPYQEWLDAEVVHLDDLPPAPEAAPVDHESLRRRQRAFGYTEEDLRILLGPMAAQGVEPVGSMGTDTALAVLSDRPRLLYDYFKQLFAQVTNPPLDAIREELVTDMSSTLGAERNLLKPEPGSCHQIRIEYPILDNDETARIRHNPDPALRAVTLSTLFDPREGSGGIAGAMDELCRRASAAVADGCAILVLSDRGVDADHAPIPALLATAGVHHHLVREGTRTRCALLVESGEPREPHHMSLLLGYGAGAINPYVAFETIEELIERGDVADVDTRKGIRHHILALTKGVLKVMSKMGISTLQSYRGAQIFEAVGLDKAFVDRYFTWTASRLEGIGIDTVEAEVTQRHRAAFPTRGGENDELDSGGEYQWRRDGEYHLFNPDTVYKLQHATRSGQYAIYRDYARLVNDQNRKRATLRGLFRLRPGDAPVPLDEVEPVESIFKRFSTGAMSFGSISAEAHETLAIAMNRIGGKSNTGEGGEDPARFTPDPNGDLRRSAVKQVASGRFGVTSEYLVNADDLQIKMAQGAKPGEGGQLPGFKVYPFIAKIRYSTPGVTLISPPPHHDIYSIEDLAQLIHDLKNSNPRARVHVKLVAEVGVGTVAAGVAKAHSDVVLISGHDGGTGASPLTSIKHAGVPWELGLAETQQVLVMNQLRDRIVVQTDGQMKTGRDVVIAALLGAEEYGFSTAPLVVEGCIMMRVCHLDTCPVGIATQNPELRKHFSGRPEFVENYFRFVGEEVREAMAEMGFRTMEEMIGRVDRLDTAGAVDHWKARGLDLSPILLNPDVPDTVARRCVREQDHGLERALDNTLIERCAPAVEDRTPVSITLPIRNVNRTVGTMLGLGHHPQVGRGGAAGRDRRRHLHGVGGTELRRLPADRGHPDHRGRRQRLLRQGPLGRPPRRVSPAGLDVRRRGEHRHRQRRALRRHRGGGVRARRRGRAVRGAQQRRERGGGRRRRPRLRVHDGRPRGDPGADGTELRGGHERRHRLRPRPDRHLRPALQPRHGRPRDARRRGRRARAAAHPAARRPHRERQRAGGARRVGHGAAGVRQGDAARLQAGAHGRGQGAGRIARAGLRRAGRDRGQLVQHQAVGEAIPCGAQPAGWSAGGPPPCYSGQYRQGKAGKGMAKLGVAGRGAGSPQGTDPGRDDGGDQLGDDGPGRVRRVAAQPQVRPPEGARG